VSAHRRGRDNVGSNGHGRQLDVTERAFAAFDSHANATPEELALDGGIYDPSAPLVELEPMPERAAQRTRRAVATPASKVKRERAEWLMPERVPLGMVTVVAGVGGLGKSQWTCGLASRVSRGKHGRPPAAVLLLNAEDSWSLTIKPRLEAARADLDLVQFVNIASEDGDDGLTIPDDVFELGRLVAEHRAELVIVDTLVAHLPTGIDSHKDQSVRRALAPLHRLAEKQRCAVAALVHLNKAQGISPLMRLGGSVGFGNAARSVLLLERDPDDPEGEEGKRRVLAHIKCNVAPLAPSLLYQVAPILLPAGDGNPETETSRLELLGESAHNGRSLLAAVNEEERSAVDEAIAYLEAELGDGARHLAADLLRDARKIGISEPTLRRARKRLGILTEKAGLRGGWEWWLPKASTGDDDDPDDDPRRLRETQVSMRVFDASERPENTEGVTPGTLTPSAILTPSDEPAMLETQRTLDEALADALFVSGLVGDGVLARVPTC
jgi:hypothetical protein